MEYDVRNRIKKIVSEVLKINVDDTTAQTTCVEWDSLRHLNLIIELEIEFDISFEPEEMACMKSIDTIGKIVSAKL
jgi:acyl carrier protein